MSQASQPVHSATARGEAKVGVELEFGRLDVDEAALAVVALFGGEVHQVAPYEREVHTDLGCVRIELDSAPLKRAGDGASMVGPWAVEALAKMASELVATEIALPPLPAGQLGLADALAGELATRGAVGTFDALRFAFALQLNIEELEPEAPQILAHLRAFVELYDELASEAQPDFMRRAASFIEPYPEHYTARILDPHYAPSLEQLIDDYLADNATRYRALDLLPLFSFLDEERVAQGLGAGHAVKARPTYHYRLPNSRVGEPGWSVTLEHERWQRVQRRAEELLQQHAGGR